MTLAVKSFMEGTAEKLGVGKRTGGVQWFLSAGNKLP